MITLNIASKVLTMGGKHFINNFDKHPIISSGYSDVKLVHSASRAARSVYTAPLVEMCQVKAVNVPAICVINTVKYFAVELFYPHTGFTLTYE